MQYVQKQLNVSQRRACRALGQPRSSQRYERKIKGDEAAIEKRMLELVRKHPRRGYRLIGAMLRREGFKVNFKRVYRLWRKNHLKVPQRKVKKRSVGVSENGITRLSSTYPNQIWTWDFIFDRTMDGRSMKWLSVVDEFTRECLVLKVKRSMSSSEVIDHLREVMERRGVPGMIRSDNGPEFIAHAIQQWLSIAGVKTLYIAPGSPWENGFVESFHSRLRDELLECELFVSVKEAQGISELWREEYNHERPHSSLGYKTPAEFAAAWRNEPKRQAADEYIGDRCGCSPPEDTEPVKWSVSSDGVERSNESVKLS